MCLSVSLSSCNLSPTLSHLGLCLLALVYAVVALSYDLGLHHGQQPVRLRDQRRTCDEVCAIMDRHVAGRVLADAEHGLAAQRKRKVRERNGGEEERERGREKNDIRRIHACAVREKGENKHTLMQTSNRGKGKKRGHLTDRVRGACGVS